MHFAMSMSKRVMTSPPAALTFSASITMQSIGQARPQARQAVQISRSTRRAGSGVGFNVFHDMFGTPDDWVWGDQVTDEATWGAHNPTDHAADLHRSGYRRRAEGET